MDFLKHCKTNVQLIEDASKIHYCVYGLDGPEEQSSIRRVLAEFRDRDVLCASEGFQVLLFASSETDLPAGLVKIEEGKLNEDPPKWTKGDKTAIDILLEAIEAALSFGMAREYNMLHVEPWTWLFNDTAAVNAPAVILKLHLTASETGALYATITLGSSDLIVIEDPNGSKRDKAFLAPCGTMVEALRDVPHRDEKAQRIAQETNDAHIFMGDRWKRNVVDELRTIGIQLNECQDWLLVQITGHSIKHCALWPAGLVLRHATIDEKNRSSQVVQDGWKNWFLPTEDGAAFRDPWTVAEDWYSRAVDRANTLSAAKAAEAQASHVVNNPDSLGFSATIAMDQSLVTSPPFIQRNVDQLASMSGIYPTPPGGILPGSQLQQLSSDNALAQAQNEVSTLGNEGIQSGNDLNGQVHSADSTEQQGFPGNDNEDDLFGEMGEMGEMDFTGEEVGDADFSFFDEPDEVPDALQDNDADMLEVHVGEAIDVHDSETPVAGDLPATDDQDIEAFEDASVPSTWAVTDPAPHDECETNLYVRASEPNVGHQDILFGAGPGPKELEKPLSPFGVKERLLPPPIPASTIQDQPSRSPRNGRNSIFHPLTFRHEVDLGQKYATSFEVDASDKHPKLAIGSRDIRLPLKRKKSRIKRPPDRSSEISESSSESEEDSYESASSISDEDLPPKLPWNTKKRRRATAHDLPVTGSFERMWSDGEIDDRSDGQCIEKQMQTLLQELLSRSTGTFSSEGSSATAPVNHSRSMTNQSEELKPSGALRGMEELFELTKLDLVYIAQIVSEQAASYVNTFKSADYLESDDGLYSSRSLTIQSFAEKFLRRLLPTTNSSDISSLATSQESHHRLASTAMNVRPGQPRPVQRGDNWNHGPDIFPIPPPYIRVQRGQDVYEMLPPALDFWETLNLGPSNDIKNVRAFCVFPQNDDVCKLVDRFMSDLGSAYENCKLGSHVHIRNVNEDSDMDAYEDGLAPVELNGDFTLESALQGYHEVCKALGLFLSSIGHDNSDRTIVVYIVNPFPHRQAAKYLCACFWQIYQAYRLRLSKPTRAQPRSDIVLQLIPIEFIASAGGFVFSHPKQMSALAKEVYDRCPPSASNDADIDSALPCFAAPFVELASVPLKRIGFQLSAHAPADLLHECSVLHLAYCMSGDGQWMSVAWIDGTGRYQSSASLCLQGMSFWEIAEEIWDRTRDIIAAREVTWRVFLLTDQNVDEPILHCWRQLVKERRKQPFSVTFLFAQLDATLKLTPPPPPSPPAPPPAIDDAAVTSGSMSAAFLTPATTPQGANFTASPDANGYSNAPLTPAPSEAPAAIAETDADAHLVNLMDDSWGVLLSPAFARKHSGPPALAYGALYKRGEAGLREATNGPPLPGLSVELMWTVQVRPNGLVDEGNTKQAELTLREVLKMYRNLSVLTQARWLDKTGPGGPDGCGGGVRPIHLVVAKLGAESLQGFLS